MFFMSLGGYYLLITKPVQNLIGKRILSEIAQRTDTKIEASQVSFGRFKRLEISDLYIEDKHSDTLIYAPKAVAVLDSLNRSFRRVDLQRLRLTSPIINIAQDDSSVFNFMFLVDSLYDKNKPDSLRWKVGFKHIEIEKGVFSLDLQEQSPFVFEDFTLVSDMKQKHIKLSRLHFSMPNGFVLKNAQTQVNVDDDGVRIPRFSLTTEHSSVIFKNISVLSPHSRLKRTPLDSLLFGFQSDNSRLGGDDISCFLPPAFATNSDVLLDGRVEGTLKKLRGQDIHFKVSETLDVHGDFVLTDVVEAARRRFDVQLHDVAVDVEGAASIYNMLRPESLLDTALYAHWKAVDFAGHIFGTHADFDAEGEVKTPYGEMLIDVSVSAFDDFKGFEYHGDIAVEHFDLGGALKRGGIMGEMSAELFTKGKMEADGAFENYFKGTVFSLEAMGYPYHNLLLEGDIGQGYFNGNLNIADENAKLDFKGEVDFLSEEPMFNFTLDVEHLALAQLKLTEAYEQLDLSFRVDSKLKGKHVDDLNGFLDIDEFSLVSEHGRFMTDSIMFGFRPLAKTPTIALHSEYVDGLLLGTYNFSEILGYFNASLRKHNHHLPHYFAQPKGQTVNDFAFSFEVENLATLASTLDFPLRANGFSLVSGKVNSLHDVYKVNVDIPYLMSKKQLIESILIDVENTDSGFLTNVAIGKLTFAGQREMKQIDLHCGMENDTVFLSSTWDNGEGSGYRGDFKANVHFTPHEKGLETIFEILPSQFLISDSLWHLNRHEISLRHQNVSVDSLFFNNGNSYFSLNGVASAVESDAISLEMKDFDLSYLSRFVHLRNFDFGGFLSGKVEFFSLWDKPVFTSDVKIDSLNLNGSHLGTTTAVSAWETERKKLKMKLDCRLPESEKHLLTLAGSYDPEHDVLSAHSRLDGVDIVFLQPFLQKVMTELGGKAFGGLDIQGSIRNPELYGALKVNEGSFRIDYLSTDFYINDSIYFEKERFVFSTTEVHDRDGNSAKVNGNITHTAYKNMLVDIIVESDRFLGMNTTASENEYFYGDVYFGGAITIKSTADHVIIGSDVRTQKGSFLTLPLSPASTANVNNFITYVLKEKDLAEEKPQLALRKEVRKPKNLVINMNFDLTDDMQVNLEFDAQSGDFIEAVGDGNLNVQFERGQPFQMFGEYRISRGDYYFTLQQIFNREFEILSGSTLRWSGPPAEAVTDITAVFSTRASLYNLMPDAVAETNKNNRVPVNAKMRLTEQLSRPNIAFDIELPNTDEETQQNVSSIINTEEEMNRQVISLLVTNSFYTPEYYINAGDEQTNNQLRDVAAATVSEFLSSQLSNWISQISNNLDLGLRYTPEQQLMGEGLTPEEYEVIISTQFFDDRLTVNSNVGYRGYTAETLPPNLNSNFVGEIDIELKLNKNMKLRAYSHQNDDVFYESSGMKQGAGISYREDFTTLKGLWARYMQRVRNFFSGKKKEKTGNKPSPDGEHE